MSHNPVELWTPAFLLAILVNFFLAIVFYTLMTTMALYAVDRFGASDTAAGLSSSTFIIGALIARIFAGKFLDFVGRRRMLILALAAYVIAGFLYIPADNLVLLLVVRTIHGIAFGAASTSISASVMGLIPAHRRGEGTGYFGISTTLATAIGPFLAVVLVDVSSYDVLFALCTACAAVGLIFSLFLKLPERTPSALEVADKWKFRARDLFEPAALTIGAVMFVAAIGYSGVLAFLNSFAQAENMVAAASAFFLIYAAVVLLSRFFVGRIQDRFGDNAVVYPTLISFAIGLALLGFSPNGFVLASSAVFIGFGFGALMPCAQAIAVTMAPPHRIGVATSTFFLMLDAGIGFGPLVLGSLLPVTGFHGMYGFLAIVVVLAAVLYHFVHGQRGYRRSALAA
ncbi:MFS transporter [Mycetocola manganoxydans]|uniref:MFS transporter n=1 Tax=Mycetocola manganoxydans TaxID=699879 RepID=A0A3L6ZJX4_9MICO|nr:MFS transporter [Mycetocola manganoxydans]RLP68294.1 MFS transporter [Mycetocola manganoxydans]GHD43552.1 MFS transporter [Mycetocola manganoxydans]